MPQFSVMSEHSTIKGTPQHIREWLTCSAPASPVNPSALQESKAEKTIPGICGPQLSQPSAQYDPATASWKMSQGWLLLDISAPSWETWPKAGTIADGVFYPQPNWERRISGIGFGLLPTPAAQEPGLRAERLVDKNGETPTKWNQRMFDRETGRLAQRGLTQFVQMYPTPLDPSKGGGSSRSGSRINETPTLHGMARKGTWPTPTRSDGMGGPGHSGRQGGLNLRTAVQQSWATPTTRDWRSGKASEETHAKNSRPLSEQVGQVENGGQLNPEWVEWLMGWPVGWTDLKPLEMGKFRQWQQQHGRS